MRQVFLVYLIGMLTAESLISKRSSNNSECGRGVSESENTLTSAHKSSAGRLMRVVVQKVLFFSEQ